MTQLETIFTHFESIPFSTKEAAAVINRPHGGIRSVIYQAEDGGWLESCGKRQRNRASEWRFTHNPFTGDPLPRTPMPDPRSRLLNHLRHIDTITPKQAYRACGASLENLVDLAADGRLTIDGRSILGEPLFKVNK